MSMLILASSSPRRRELLQQIGADFTVCPGTYDEDVPGRDNPEKFVHTQAVGKAASVAALYPHAWVVGADTIVAANGKILGKPRSEAEAVQMLRNLSGKGHDVYTGIALQCGESVYSHVEKTSVFSAPLRKRKLRLTWQPVNPWIRRDLTASKARGPFSSRKLSAITQMS